MIAKTKCCQCEYMGDNHSPIRDDGYCMNCGHHPVVAKLKKLLGLALGDEGLGFYGDTDNWVQECEGNWYGAIVHEDISSINCQRHMDEWGEPFADKGGKRARATRAEIVKQMGGMQ